MSETDTSYSQASRVIRRVRHLLMLLLVPALIAAVSAWFYLHGGRYVSTDNAYIKTDILSISSSVSGMVTEILVRENESVSTGQLLLKVDDQPYIIALARAEANLANVRRDIESLKAEYVNKQLGIETADNDLAYRDSELVRIQRLFDSSSISEAQFDQARYARDSARKNLSEKQQALQVTRASLVDPALPSDEHPRVKQALAELDKARLDLRHTEVRAPKDGIIAGITSHVGENVMTGAPLLNLIDLSRLWITANFKETDLTYMSLGQEVEVTVDAYPGQTWHGQVEVITPATGAEFSLLPAQNSTGNWVKVVQRVPVMIVLNDYDGAQLLASGMSAEVRVDTRHQRDLNWVADLVR